MTVIHADRPPEDYFDNRANATSPFYVIVDDDLDEAYDENADEEESEIEEA